MGNHFATHLNCIIARNGWICCEDLAFRIHFLDPTLWKTSLPCRSPQLDWNIYVESAQQFHRNVAMVSVNFAIFPTPLTLLRENLPVENHWIFPANWYGLPAKKTLQLFYTSVQTHEFSVKVQNPDIFPWICWFLNHSHSLLIIIHNLSSYSPVKKHGNLLGLNPATATPLSWAWEMEPLSAVKKQRPQRRHLLLKRHDTLNKKSRKVQEYTVIQYLISM